MRNVFTTYIATAKQNTGTFFKSFILLCAFSLGFSYLTIGQVTETFTSNGTWNVPAGVTQITVTCFGGGGAGGGASATSRNGGGGGGGASVTVTNYPVTPGTPLTIVVGQGGTGVSANTGNPGGASSVTAGATMFIRAAGGAGGQRGSSSTTAGAGGAGGAIANNIPANTGFRGGNGGNSDPVTTSTDRSGGGGGGAGTTAAGSNGTIVTGGAGGATGGGAGGAGASTTSSAGANGTAGSTLGGGGGGATVWSGSNRAGAAGARGEVRITYVACTAPTALTYTSNTAVYCRNLAISTNTPSFTGSAATSYSVSPALPAGLTLNTSNGTITGTPTTAQAAANYTITVNNNCGSTTRVLSIAVNATPTANAGTNVSVARGTAAAITGASFTGATGVSWTSSVPGTFSPSATATNPTWLPNDPVWTGSATLTMTTTGAAPCNNTSSNITVTVTVPAICPGQNTGSATFNAGGGGGTSSYEVSINDGVSYVAYTPGAAINTTSATGSVRIRTTQTVNGCTNSAVYTLWTIRTDCCNQPTVTATTAASAIACTTATTGGDITVAGTDPCTFVERGVVYATTTSPTIANSKVAVSGSSGSFSANLTGLSNGTLYYVRAYATSSSGTVYGPQISFTTLAAPSNLNYTLNTVTYCTGSAITANNPTFTGASATSYSVSPALPTGLTLNTTTGAITGTPSVAVAAANYTVTVNNACGNTTRAVNITVIAPPTSPSFTAGATKLCNGATSTYTATASGGGLSIAYSILSGGATIDAGTGVVSNVTSNFTVRATITNTCGSITVDRAVEVLTPNAVRNAPTGAQCSGTTLNFSAAPAGGNGTFAYAWNVRTNGTGTYGSGTGFPLTPHHRLQQAVQLRLHLYQPILVQTAPLFM